MGKKQITEAERQERRKRAMHNRVNGALAEIGVDVTDIPASDREALAQAERNVRKLRAIADQMRRRGSPTDPTPERLAHAAEKPRTIEVSPADAKAHAFDWTLAGLRDRLSTRQYEAAERLRDAWAAMQPRSAVASLEGSGGRGDPSGRLALTEAQEIAAREVAWVMDRIPTRELRQAVENFVLERSPFADGERPLSLEEYGTRVCKFGRDRNRAAAIRDVVLACAFIDHLWHMLEVDRKQRCARTDGLMRSEIGRRAGGEGWICALWDFCYSAGRLPKTEAEMNGIRAAHDAKAIALRREPQFMAEKYYQRRDRLTALAFRERGDGRVRMAS